MTSAKDCNATDFADFAKITQKVPSGLIPIISGVLLDITNVMTTNKVPVDTIIKHCMAECMISLGNDISGILIKAYNDIQSCSKKKDSVPQLCLWNISPTPQQIDYNVQGEALICMVSLKRVISTRAFNEITKGISNATMKGLVLLNFL